MLYLYRMNRVFRFLALGLVFIATAGAGPGDGGGGGSIIRCDKNSPWVLLDRVNRNPSLLTPLPIRASAAVGGAKAAQLQEFEIKNTEAYSRAREILARWKDASPALTRMIEDAMGSVPYLRTSSAFALSPQFTLAPEAKRKCPKLEIQTSILYLPKYGSIISAPYWDALDVDTQAGLLIHEAFRQVQMGYLYHTENGDLEAVTAQLIDGDPKEKPSPDQSSHIRGKLRNYLDAWGTYRSAGGAESDPKEACSHPGSKPQLVDFCALSLAISLNLELNDLINQNQIRRTRSEKELQALWQKLVDEKFLRK